MDLQYPHLLYMAQNVINRKATQQLEATQHDYTPAPDHAVACQLSSLAQPLHLLGAVDIYRLLQVFLPPQLAVRMTEAGIFRKSVV